jgi:heme oxygenase
MSSGSPSLQPFATLLRQYKLERTRAFESDMVFHSRGGTEKEDNEIPEAVKSYLERLESCAATDPELLAVYVYHMYMALLSGKHLV